MPRAFDTWTILPHQPIERLAENLWTVSGILNGSTQRRMTLARLDDGRVIVHNAIALEEDLMKELEGWGTISALVVPNGYHRMDSKIWKDRYPSVRVYCPKGATKAVQKVVPVDGDYAAAPSDRTVRLFHLGGSKDREGVMEIRSRSGVTLVFNDAIMNVPKASGVMGFFLGPTGRTSVPRVSRWFLASDKLGFKRHIETLASTEGLARLIFGHGSTINENAPEALRKVAEEL
ncbi:MAG: hypothetical protein HYV07_05330 [Deltaproteobacteria bacterium]|nr:hypothetical protein [Deltaproteobacteria bacterium]